MSEAEADFEDSDKSDMGDEQPATQSTSGVKPPSVVYQVKELLHDHLISSGQRSLLGTFIQNRLSNTGCSYFLREQFIQYIRMKGPANVNVSHMIEDVHPIGRKMLPVDLKEELKEFLLDFAKQLVVVDDSAPGPTQEEMASTSHLLKFRYQERDVVPDPGLGVNVEESDCSTSNSASNSSVVEQVSSPDSGSSTPRAQSHGLSPAEEMLRDSHIESSSEGDSDMHMDENEPETAEDKGDQAALSSDNYDNLYGGHRGDGRDQNIDFDSYNFEIGMKELKQEAKKKIFEEDEDSSSTHTYATNVDDDEEELPDIL